MAEKKYYWLKLQKDFFKRHDIRIIEDMPNGKDYILFYLKLLLESLTHEGQLRFSETIPYNEQMLSTITNTNVDIVRSAMKVFTELEMIEVLEDKTIYMAEVSKMIGCETDWAKKKRVYREKSEDNKRTKKDNVRQEIEIELELEKEIERESNIEKLAHGNHGNVFLSEKEYQELKEKFPNDYEKKIDYLSQYLKTTGKSYENHFDTIVLWSMQDKKKEPVKKDTYLKRGYDYESIEKEFSANG